MGVSAASVRPPIDYAERAAAMRQPGRKARILAEKSERLAGDGTPVPPLVDMLLARIEMIAGRMFPLDSKLAQLRADAALSTTQLANHRLTGAQDLAWAIINNPAFLFNR